jgi:hypothetical protein
MAQNRAYCEIRNQKWVFDRQREWRETGPAARSGIRNEFKKDSSTQRARFQFHPAKSFVYCAAIVFPESHQRKNSEENIFQTKVFPNSKNL